MLRLGIPKPTRFSLLPDRPTFVHPRLERDEVGSNQRRCARLEPGRWARAGSNGAVRPSLNRQADLAIALEPVLGILLALAHAHMVRRVGGEVAIFGTVVVECLLGG